MLVLSLLSFGLYLQHGLDLEPCPMCVVQRYLWCSVGIFAAWGMCLQFGFWRHWAVGGIGLSSTLGFGVAARQSWLQWFPPEFASCGRDIYGMIENFPLKKVLPMLFQGSGDCTKVDWMFLGGSVANWSAVAFFITLACCSFYAFCVHFVHPTWDNREFKNPNKTPSP